jgi:oxygen-independent coproporphyrinogen-3 oxidase
METLGLYIQVPFCASKCTFCNFSSRVARQDVYGQYCQALVREIERLPEIYKTAEISRNVFEAQVDSVYIGGGTPSLLGAERIEKIVADLNQRFQSAANVEFTLEVTPGSANRTFLKRALALGINRLSIGAQSFADEELRSVGRLHSAADTRAFIETARIEGFANISVDLIAGLPHQTLSSWQSSLESVTTLRPEHVSVYLFELDEKSRLGGEVLRHGVRYHADAIPDEEFMADAYNQARRALHQAGYVQYEISNFSLPGHESRHNQKYWQLDPYIGLGAGAHSYDGQFRWENPTPLEEYERRLAQGESPIWERHWLTPDAQLEEFFFLGLRQSDGVNLADARQRWGRESIERLWAKVEPLQNDGWLEHCDGRLRLAEKSLLISNEIFQEFIAV